LFGLDLLTFDTPNSNQIMKTKLIFLTLLGIVVIWGCGKKKSMDDTALADTIKVAPPAPRIQVISLPDLGMQSLLRNPKDSTKKEWKESMINLKGLNKSISGTETALRMMSVCCPCADGTGCCLCSRDTTEVSVAMKSVNVMLAAPKEITHLDLVFEAKPATTIPLTREEIESFNVFSLKRGVPNGKYFLRMKGDFKGGEMKCYLEIKNDIVELLPRK